ncbi:MAG: HAD hydrolase family protein, partial [Longicatena sp.]
MKNTKAIFFDVDSTIYSHRIHDFPTSTKETLQTLKANGYKIGIATSRCRYEMKNLP